MKKKTIKKTAPKKATSKKTIKKKQSVKNPTVKEHATTALSKSFPFWGRLKIDKNRITLVIDETNVVNKQTKRVVEGYVHREGTHTANKKYEKISPNPNKNDNKPLYLKKPRKIPKILVKPMKKQLNMPESLKRKYEKNNKK